MQEVTRLLSSVVSGCERSEPIETRVEEITPVLFWFTRPTWSAISTPAAWGERGVGGLKFFFFKIKIGMTG